MTAVTLGKQFVMLRGQWSIASILTLSMVSVIVLLVATVTIVDIRRERTVYHDSVVKRGLFLASGFNDIMADYLYYTEIDSLRDISGVIRSLPDITYVRVFRPDGRLVVDTQRGDKSAEYPVGFVTDDMGLDVINSDKASFRFEGDDLHVTSPIRVGNNVTGALQIGFDGDSLGAEIKEIVFQHLLQGLALVTFGAGLAYVISRRVIQPIEALSAAAEQIGHGNLEEPVPAKGAKETMALGHALEQMRVELRKMYSALEDANQELEAFSYSVSHDLRAPLRSMNGFSQALLEEHAEKLDDQGKDYLKRVRTSSQRMSDLIDDLLQLSRITRSDIAREEVDLSSLANGVIAELQEAEPDRQVEAVVAPGLIASGDRHLLSLALQNLLTNAWKFTAKHHQARVEFGVMQNEEAPTYFVRDDGIGFDMAYSDKLFNAFQRLHSPAEFEGTGIGLAIARRVIHRHGGRIWAEGAVEQGATFYFTL